MKKKHARSKAYVLFLKLPLKLPQREECHPWAATRSTLLCSLFSADK